MYGPTGHSHRVRDLFAIDSFEFIHDEHSSLLWSEIVECLLQYASRLGCDRTFLRRWRSGLRSVLGHLRDRALASHVSGPSVRKNDAEAYAEEPGSQGSPTVKSVQTAVDDDEDVLRDVWKVRFRDAKPLKRAPQEGAMRLDQFRESQRAG
jgi:hypothetical protein